MYSFDNLSSSLGSISSALALPVSRRRHGKLVDNFSHESDVTSLQDPFTSRPYTGKTPFYFYYCVPRKIRRDILFQKPCRIFAIFSTLSLAVYATSLRIIFPSPRATRQSQKTSPFSPLFSFFPPFFLLLPSLWLNPIWTRRPSREFRNAYEWCTVRARGKPRSRCVLGYRARLLLGELDISGC